MLHSRKERLEELIHQEVAKIIDQLKDPRMGMVTVSEVRLTNDIKLATIYVSILETERIPEIMKTLKQARGYIKKVLASRIVVKFMPDIQFKYDETIQRAARIEQLLQLIKKEHSESEPPREDIPE